MTDHAGDHPLQILRKIAYRDETVALDGIHFQDCTFLKCELLYDGGLVIFERTRFTECDYMFGSHARRTLDLLQLMGLMGNPPVATIEGFGAIN